MARATKENKRPKEQMKLHDDPPFALIESFRNLSTNIGFTVPKKADGKGRLICISSAIPNEGKTTISVNLAISCAGAGEKTILLDCDMRKPTISRFFKNDNPQGVVEYLSGQVELNEVLVKQAAPNLDVIYGKKAAPNPLFLIKNERFQALLDSLESIYDYVIIDTPPLGIVADALEISKHTDGIILVARQMESRIPIIKQTVLDVEFAGVNFLGFILNDYQSKAAGKGYYGNYKYGYKK